MKWNVDKKKGTKMQKNEVHRDKKPVSKSQRECPLTLAGGYSFFIYLELSAEAQADKQLQLSCERLMPQPGPH